MGLYFDGTDDYVNVDSVVDDISSDNTGFVSALIKPVDSTPAAISIIVCLSIAATLDLLMLYMHTDGTLRCLCRSNTQVHWLLGTDSKVLFDDTWTHIMVYQDASTPILKVDGVTVSQTLITSTARNGYWFNDVGPFNTGRIGCGNYNAAGNINFFNGEITEVVVCGPPSMDLVNISSNVKRIAIQEPYRRGYWPCFDGSHGSADGDTVKDLSGNGNDGTGSGTSLEWREEKVLSLPS